MKFVKTILVVLVLAVLSAPLASNSRADESNKKTIMTFSQAVEIPGQVLPAGTYTFVLADSPADRHIVQIFNADGTQIIATILAINNYRLKSSGDTIVKFAERAGDSPEALKAWFYPGDNFGQEFVYPKQRALELAGTTKEPILAIGTDTSDLRVATIVAVTPAQQEVPAAEAVQSTEAATPVAASVAPDTSSAPVTETTPIAKSEPMPEATKEVAPAPKVDTAELPQTASNLSLIALLGLVSLSVAFILKRLAS